MFFYKIFSIKRVEIFILFFIFCLTNTAFAGQVSLLSSLGVKGEYNDNVNFDRENEIDDYITTISPAFKLGYSTALFDINAETILDFLLYHYEPDLNEENQEYNLDAAYHMTERLTLSGDFSYIKDTTLDSELEETGIVNHREDRRRYDSGGGMVYEISERNDLGCDYNFTKINYDEDDKVDYERHTVKLPFNYYLKNQRDTLTLQPEYSFRDSDVSEVDNYKINVGWSHLFSETFTLKVFAGGRYTETRYEDERDNGYSDGFNADIQLKNTGETNRSLIGYRRDLRTRASGTEIEVDKFYCRMDQLITERFGVGFDGKLYFTREEDDDNDTNNNDEDSVYFTVEPSLFYKITEQHLLRLAYAYAREDDDARDNDQVKDRHKVWLSLSFNFPKQW